MGLGVCMCHSMLLDKSVINKDIYYEICLIQRVTITEHVYYCNIYILNVHTLYHYIKTTHASCAIKAKAEKYKINDVRKYYPCCYGC